MKTFKKGQSVYTVLEHDHGDFFHTGRLPYQMGSSIIEDVTIGKYGEVRYKVLHTYPAGSHVSDYRGNEVFASEKAFKSAITMHPSKVIKKYINHAMYSDVHPYEVVKVISDKTVEIRAMDAKQIKFPSDFHVGGFAGHFADNRSGQEYEYTSNEDNEIIRVRWSEANKQWQQGKYVKFRMSDTPYKFHDYNF